MSGVNVRQKRRARSSPTATPPRQHSEECVARRARDARRLSHGEGDLAVRPLRPLSRYQRPLLPLRVLAVFGKCAHTLLRSASLDGPRNQRRHASGVDWKRCVV